MQGRRAVHNSATSRQAVGYIRVSTQEQAREGFSLPAQEERVRAFAVGTGRSLGGVIADDGLSASTLRRPGMQRILQQIRAGAIDAVVVTKLDRLTRSIRDLLELLDLFEKHEVALVRASETLDTSTAMGRMVIRTIANIAEWEREAIGERTAFALSHKRRAGKVYGPVPFGWCRSGDELVINAEQQSALKMAQQMSASGASLHQIAAELNKQGVRTKRGGSHWHAASVRSILNSKAAAEHAA